jgi:hypothetical protein
MGCGWWSEEPNDEIVDCALNEPVTIFIDEEIQDAVDSTFARNIMLVKF